MYDLIIVGGGPAGLTAMVYAIRKHLNALLVSRDLGGKTNYHLELPDVSDYRVIRGIETVERFKAELEYLDFARHLEGVKRISSDGEVFTVATEYGGSHLARAVIVASGARPQHLDVPGEDQFLGRGLAYSAMSYTGLMIDRSAAVVGNGELALRSAAELATVARQVHLVGPDSKILNSRLGKKVESADNVIVYEGGQLVEVRGNSYAETAVIEVNQAIKEIATDCIFVEKRLIPNSEMVSDLVDLDEQGRIKIDCSTRTSTAGLFAAGDVTTLYAEQVLIAVGEGAKAALCAYDYLLPAL